MRASDNLRHAVCVLLVEGGGDKRAIEALLRHRSSTIRKALEHQALAIDTLGGGTNLTYKASLIKQSICLVHCFLDHDSAGLEGARRAEKEQAISPSEVNFSTVPGRKESEFEDLVNVQLYKDRLETVYGFTLDAHKFEKGKSKWSERMRDAFFTAGKPWSDQVLADVKNLVNDLVAANPATPLHNAKIASFSSFQKALEKRLSVQ